MAWDERVISDYKAKLRNRTLPELRDEKDAWKGRINSETDLMCWREIYAECMTRGMSYEEACQHLDGPKESDA